MRSRSWLSACTAAVLVAPLLTVAAATRAVRTLVRTTPRPRSPDLPGHRGQGAEQPAGQDRSEAVGPYRRPRCPSSSSWTTTPSRPTRAESPATPRRARRSPGGSCSGSGAERRYEGTSRRVERTFAATSRAPPEGTGRPAPAHRLRRGRAHRAGQQGRHVLSIPGVVAVQKRRAAASRRPTPARSFIGADRSTRARRHANAGKGVIFGSLDTGVWPEHPSFADNGNLGAPPAKADGTPRACDFGDNPLTPADRRVRLQQQAHRRPGRSWPPTTPASPAPRSTRPRVTPTVTARTPRRPPPVTRSPRPRCSASSAARSHGIAPGAWLSVYKVCGAQGLLLAPTPRRPWRRRCSDGVKVINFSISGGGDPFTDPVELAFLDAYAAGVFVAASAGNAGPGAATTDHLSPWVTTVAASTQKREFDSTLTADQRRRATRSCSRRVDHRRGRRPAARRAGLRRRRTATTLCDAPAPAGIFAGKIVACQRGGERAASTRASTSRQGGAAGMILYNPTLADVETDNHWLPTVHLADGTAFLAFAGGPPGR